MFAKRVLFITLVASVITLAVVVVPGSARLEPPRESSSKLPSPLYRFGEEVKLSPDGNAERYQPQVAYNYQHDQYLVVWHNTWSGSRDVYARRVSSTGQTLSWWTVTTGANDRLQPAVAYNATADEYLVVWMYEASANVFEIWGRLVAWDGAYMNSEFRIIQWANRSFWTPRVAWNSYRNEYLVVWNALDTTVGFPYGTPCDIAGYRVSASGVVQNPGSPLIMTASDSPGQVDIVYNVAMDEYFLVFVVVHTQATTGNDIYGLRVSWNGTPVGSLIYIYNLEQNQNAPAVATNEQDRYMVVWEHEYTSIDHDIYGREYYATGSPVGSYFTIASWTEDTTAPDIAANGAINEWVTVWQQDLGGGTGYAIKGFRWGSGPAVWTYLFDVANYVFWENENPAVAADIPGYLIVYEGDSSMTNRHIYGRMWWPEATYLPLVVRSSS